jgi:hypothetical protein
MEIDLVTRLNHHIENEQYDGMLPYRDIHDNEEYMRLYKGFGAIWRTQPSGIYNCHGLTFASKRTRVFSTDEIRKILQEDAYIKISIENVFPGDIILYVTNIGDITHSGIILSVERNVLGLFPMVLSKWGNGSEVFHSYNNCPYFASDILTEFYRIDK